MAQPNTNNDWEQTLRKMAELGELSTAASTGAKIVSEKRGHMIDMVSKMTAKLKDIQIRINKIKDEGNTAKQACKDLIKNKYGPQQEQVVKAIMENIKEMTNTAPLEKDINDMSSMVGRLAHDAGAGAPDSGPTDPTDARRQAAQQAAAAARSGPAAAGPAAAGPAAGQKGGYTYGRSHKRAKGRRKRGKKSRKKGSHKGKK